MRLNSMLAALAAGLNQDPVERKFSCSMATLFPWLKWGKTTTNRVRNRRRKEKRRLAALRLQSN